VTASLRSLATRGGVALAIAALAFLLGLPLVAMVLDASPSMLFDRVRDPQVLGALRLSIMTSTAATGLVIVIGLPAAYVLATRRFPGKRAFEVLIQLPMVLPPTVAGFALLLAFGRAGLAGGVLEVFGLTLPFSTLGVVVAQAFMAAPFFVAPARAGIAAVDTRYRDAAATLRASEGYTFVHVTLPLALPSLAAGTAMAWARALGEFGATITFAGNLPDVTRTMPLAVYIALQQDPEVAVVMSLLLIAVAIALLAAFPFATIATTPRPPRAAG